jgi:hypothetical protein
VNRTVTAEARAQTGQAWLPAQRREPAAAGPGVSTGPGSHTGPASNTRLGSNPDRNADAGPDTGTSLNDSAHPGADTRLAASTGRRAEAPHPGRHRRAPEARASYREVFAVGEFRALFSAQALSYAGDQFAQVAIAILVYGRTHSAFLTALAYLPPIAGGPLLSGLADLFPHRRVMIVCDLFPGRHRGADGRPRASPSPRCARCCSAPCWPACRSPRRGPR